MKCKDWKNVQKGLEFAWSRFKSWNSRKLWGWTFFDPSSYHNKSLIKFVDVDVVVGYDWTSKANSWITPLSIWVWVLYQLGFLQQVLQNHQYTFFVVATSIVNIKNRNIRRRKHDTKVEC
jgi:hypothetical protein